MKSCDGEVKDINPDQYHRLCSEYLKPIIHNYKQYIRWLVDRQILEDESSWTKNYKCNGYRLNIKYVKGLYKPRPEIIYDNKLLSKLRAFNLPERVIKGYDYLYKWFSHIDADFTLADKILDDIESSNKDYHLMRLTTITIPDLQSFSIGDTNRLYTPITNIKKELRASLLVEGSPLIEIDIKSSIPMISTFLFDYSFLSKINDIITSLGIAIDLTTTTSLTYSMSLKKGKVVLVDPTKLDIQQYIDDVRNRDIYIKFRDKWNDQLGTDYTRHTAKKKLLSILNAPNYLRSPERAVLASLYPSVMSFVEGLNGRFKLNSNKSKTKDDVAPFAFLTQMIESRFILDIVCKRISEEYPHVPIFTIHDSILTTFKYQELIKSVLEEEGLSFFNAKIVVG